MDKEIRKLADVAIILRNYLTGEFGLNEFLDNELASRLLDVGIKTKLIDAEIMVIIDS